MIDLHAHSTASDGTFAPAELAMAGRGFALMAITDHDNTAGAEAFLAASRGDGIRLAGVELSVEPGAGFDKFHLLGLGIDPADPGLARFLKRILAGRNERNERIIANFERMGIPIDREALKRHANGEVLARPHFARYLAERGYADDPAAAFAEFLLPDSPRRAYEERWHPPQEEAFAAIHSAGGIAVMAHPKYWKRPFTAGDADYADIRRGLSELKEKGLDGLETNYFRNTPEEDCQFNRIAISLGLVRTAGSDFHGANKPDVPLGMKITDEKERIDTILAAISFVRSRMR